MSRVTAIIIEIGDNSHGEATHTSLGNASSFRLFRTRAFIVKVINWRVPQVFSLDTPFLAILKRT